MKKSVIEVTAFVLLAPTAAAIAGALVETIPVGLDDNLSVPFAVLTGIVK